MPFYISKNLYSKKGVNAAPHRSDHILVYLLCLIN